MSKIETSEYNTIKSALVNRNLKQALYDKGKVIMDGVLLTLHGDEHRKRRKLEHKIFQRDFFKYYERELFPKTLNETIKPFLENGKADLLDFGYRITMNLTADFAGIDRPKKTPKETEDLLSLVKIFSQGATLVHSKRPHEEVNNEVLIALEKFEKKFLSPSKKRREKLIKKFRNNEISEKELPRDVLTILLRNEDKINLNKDLIKREIAFYLQAGSHSTANSMTHALHEIFTWGENYPDEFERIKNDDLFLQRCVHESMRLHPASPVAWRKSECPVKLENNLKLNKGDLIIMDLHKANQDKKIFGDDSDIFNPHRIIPKNQFLWGLTFGIGLHMCFGRDLDGGVVSNESTNPNTHQYGIVTLLVKKILGEKGTPDPKIKPKVDINTERPNWGVIPNNFRRKIMKTAIVTGAGAGIGEAISKKLSQNNYQVGMLDLDKDNVVEASKKIKNATPLCGDVTQEESIIEAFKEFGKTPDLLVNNVGIVLFGPLEEHSISDYSKSLNINLLGSFVTTRILITDMINRGNGSIINMSSINGINPGIGIGAYPASKAGIISMTQQMAIEWGKFGIRVNCISPGFIDAGMSKPIYADNKVRALRGGAVPTGRLGEADDIANAVIFLDSEDASYINGHNLVVDGGVSSSVIAQLPRE